MWDFGAPKKHNDSNSLENRVKKQQYYKQERTSMLVSAARWRTHTKPFNTDFYSTKNARTLQKTNPMRGNGVIWNTLCLRNARATALHCTYSTIDFCANVCRRNAINLIQTCAIVCIFRGGNCQHFGNGKTHKSKHMHPCFPF